MKKILIHYFTGTGNTAHAVNRISKELLLNNFEVELINIRKEVKPPKLTPDFHLFAFPVLSWSAPVLVKKYISKINPGNGAKTAILAINGSIIYKGEIVRGYTGQALEEIERILKRKKFDVFLSGNASYPDNWTQMTNPCKPEDIKLIFNNGDSDIDRFIDLFIAEKKELYRCGVLNILWSYLVAFLFGKIGRRVLGQFFIADENCTNCGLCVRSCPVNAIKNGKEKPYWSYNCEDCNRCINICPEKAIQVSLPLLIIQIIINFGLTIGAISAVFHYTPLYLKLENFFLIPIELFISLIVFILAFWFTLIPLDAFFRILMKIRGVRSFFCKSFTHNFRRYKAPGFNPIK